MLTLYIGDKNYSSWSMRAGVALRAALIPHQEILVRLNEPDTARQIGAISPSGRVPALRDGDLVIWDTLAIIETIAERFPERGIWPVDPAARAHARSASAEMHSGFAGLREAMPMNIRKRYPGKGHTPQADADIERIVALWSDALSRHGGPFLFGAFSAADAMFAPVVMRFVTYAVELPVACQAYVDTMLAHSAVAGWVSEAHADTRVVERYDALYG